MGPTSSGGVLLASHAAAFDQASWTAAEGVSVAGCRSAVWRKMSVATGPGQSTLTPMRCSLSSRRNASDSPTTPNFDVAYSNPEPAATSPAPDAVLTT